MQCLILTSLFFALLSAGPACERRTNEIAVLETDVGNIAIRFYEKDAPRHVENFKVLSRSGFYNGTYFHRIVAGDFIQGGDPNTRDDDPCNDGLGGPGYTLRAEISHLKHRRGTVSMARGRELDSSGSQFFICLRDLPRLDGLFTIFGEVIEGMDVVDRIAASPLDSTGVPIKKVVIRNVRIVERRAD
jgi:peptidyl-prolyl cis-trans isomerase B (cyclophilin B)